MWLLGVLLSNKNQACGGQAPWPMLPQRQVAEVPGADRREGCRGLADHEAARTEWVRAGLGGQDVLLGPGPSQPDACRALSVRPGSRFCVQRDTRGRLWGSDLPAEATKHCNCDGTSLCLGLGFPTCDGASLLGLGCPNVPSSRRTLPALRPLLPLTEV